MLRHIVVAIAVALLLASCSRLPPPAPTEIAACDEAANGDHRGSVAHAIRSAGCHGRGCDRGGCDRHEHEFVRRDARGHDSADHHVHADSFAHAGASQAHAGAAQAACRVAADAHACAVTRARACTRSRVAW